MKLSLNLTRLLSQIRLKSTKMEIVPIKALEDNYMYLVIDSKSNECAVVDPVEPHKIMNHAKKSNLNITKILTTHHHWDHANGNPEMLKLLNNSVPIYGGDDRIPALTNKVKHNDTLNVS
jgi:hydroxyacylglutathione hydrolase